MDAPTKPVSPTERALVEMLFENTGASILDSGGAYGRAWQHERARYGLNGGLPNNSYDGFPRGAVTPTEDEDGLVAVARRSEPNVSMDRYGCVSVSTYAFLLQCTEYVPELDRHFQTYMSRINAVMDARWRESYIRNESSPHDLAHMENFVEALLKRGIVSGGAYNGTPNTWTTVNTYNEESLLDRTLQYTQFGWDPEDAGYWLPEGQYVLLQIHGGADVRGGYTTPRLFLALGSLGLLDQGTVTMGCDNEEGVGQMRLNGTVVADWEVRHRWDSSYYGNGAFASEDGTKLGFCDDHDEHDKRLSWEIEKGYDIAERVEKDDGTVQWLCPHDGTPMWLDWWCGE